MMVPINYWAVLVAAIVAIVLGFVWYGPLFGKKWAELSGLSMDTMKKPQASKMVIMVIGTLIMSWVLAHAVVFANAYLNTSGVSSGLMVGFLNWLGFVAPVTLGVVLWEGKSWKLWWINSGYYLVELCIMAVILALWI
jgi:hypothetical protein